MKQPIYFASGQRLISRAFGDGGSLTRQLGHALLIHVFKDRNHQSYSGVSTATPMLMYFSVRRDRLRTESCWKRAFCSSSGNRFHDEATTGVASHPVALQLRRSAAYGTLPIGDIGFVEARNVRSSPSYGLPAPEIFFLDTAQFHFFNFTKLAEVHSATAAYLIPPPAAGAASAFDSVFT